MRARLKSFKLINDYGWLDVAEEIILSETNDFLFPDESPEDEKRLDEVHHIDLEGEDSREKQDLSWPIQSQDLRRFVDGVLDKTTGERKLKGLHRIKLKALCAFLQEKKYLSSNFLNIDKEEFLYAAAYSMSDYLGWPEAVQSELDPILFNGDYRHITETENPIQERNLAILSSPDAPFFLINEYISYIHKITRKKMRKEIFFGWAILLNDGGLLIFLKRTIDLKKKDYQSNDHIYSLQQIKTSLDGVSFLGLSPLPTVKSFPRENLEEITPDSNDINSLHFHRNFGEVCPQDEKDDRIKDGREKDEGHQPLSFQSSGLLLDNLKQFHEKAVGGEIQAEKVGKLNDDKLNETFLHACFMGEFLQVAEHIKSGADVNYRDPEMGLRALHLVAASCAELALKELIKAENLQYLVFDNENRLPSQLAWETGEDPVIGTFLQKKEMAEARALGLDYSELIKKADALELDMK